MNTVFEYFFSLYFPIFLLTANLFGNIFGFLIFLFNRKLSSIGPTIIYSSLFIFDLLIIVIIIVNILLFGFNIDILTYSSAVCKILSFMYYSPTAMSPLLLVYISIDRVISIKNPSRKNLLKNKKYQIIFILGLSLFSVLYYTPAVIGQDLIVYNSNDSLICSFINNDYQLIISLMDLIFKAILPFLVMTTSSLVLIFVIFGSRRRVLANGSITDKKRFFKDVKFSISSITFNFVFLVCVLPNIIYFFFVINYDALNFQILSCLMFIYYASNFYILLISNSIFRKEFIKFLKKPFLNRI